MQKEHGSLVKMRILCFLTQRIVRRGVPPPPTAVRGRCHDRIVASYDTPAVVLRTIRYSEADVVLALYTRERGRASAIAKGARRTTSRLGGRLQPGVLLDVSVHMGRGDLGTVRAASVLDAHAGLWVAGHRLQSAGCILETVMRVMPEEEANEEAWHLLCRVLSLLARAPAPPGPPRLDPLVLGCQAKLLVVSGLLPLLARCARCGEARRSRPSRPRPAGRCAPAAPWAPTRWTSATSRRSGPSWAGRWPRPPTPSPPRPPPEWSA